MTNSIRIALLAHAASLRTQADSIEAVANALPATQSDQLMDHPMLMKEFGIGREAIRAAAARGELAVTQGARRKLIVRRSEVERWLAARTYAPAPRRAKAKVVPIGSWEERQAARFARLKQ